MTKFNILTQSGIAALAQANQNNASVLGLLR
jgi:flagellin-like hook-associated protein FlgL